MRGVIVGVFLFLLGLFADYFLEHTVNRAPAWVGRLIAALFMPLGVFVVLLSDIVWPIITDAHRHPFLSTGIVSGAAGVIAASLWWFLVVAHDHPATEPVSQTTTVAAAPQYPTATEIANEVARQLPKPETAGAADRSDAVVITAEQNRNRSELRAKLSRLISLGDQHRRNIRGLVSMYRDGFIDDGEFLTMIARQSNESTTWQVESARFVAANFGKATAEWCGARTAVTDYPDTPAITAKLKKDGHVSDSDINGTVDGIRDTWESVTSLNAKLEELLRSNPEL